ncbi:DUF3034 family protein [Rheinheimera marina]|uniref:DUF3034 family protein n=1 Tax=Rheinheimera marina TaxID=1774958 RepID=A0ABV9JP40_9GAMM
MNKALSLLCLALSMPVLAAADKVIATGGATSIEGAAGGGIVPWAVINGYASSEQWSVNTFASTVQVDDFSLHNVGLGLSYDDRWEWSFARQKFQLDSLGGELRQDVWGVKYRLAGELLYSSMPQLSLGLQYKKHRDFTLPAAVGAAEDSGVDYYLAASKVFFHSTAGRNVLLNATLRNTDANQIGLLGFGGQGAERKWLLEASAVLLLDYQWALGTEFRQKPNQLGFADEQHWRDLFAAYFVNKHLSVVLGFVDLGDIAGFQAQDGWYLSLEGTW